MKCDKCSHDNSEYSIICEKCSAPLKIEKNEFLQEKHREKGIHIDIVDLEKTQKMPDFNHTKKKVSKVMIFFFAILLIITFYYLYCFFIDNNSKKLIDEYHGIMKDSTLAVFYFGDNKEINEKCQIYSTNYDFDYLNIKTSDISLRKKNEIRKNLNIYNLTSTFVIISNGVPISTITNVKSSEELLNYLQNNNLIPLVLGDTSTVTNDFKISITSEDGLLIYLPTSYKEDIEETDKVLVNISSQYNFNYKKIDAYLLSRKQLLKIMSQLGFSEIQEDLLIYVNSGNIVNVIEDTATDENSYFKLLTNYDIIDISSKDYLINISTSKFESLIKEKNKNVILIGTNNCNYCDRVKPILGQIAYQYGFSIYYLDATKDLNKISDLIKESGYSNGVSSTPFLMISENKKIVDCIIGLSDKKLYIDKLTEIGVIK